MNARNASDKKLTLRASARWNVNNNWLARESRLNGNAGTISICYDIFPVAYKLLKNSASAWQKIKKLHGEYRPAVLFHPRDSLLIEFVLHWLSSSSYPSCENQKWISGWYFCAIFLLNYWLDFQMIKRRKQNWNKRRSDEDRNLIPLHSIGSRLAGMPFAPTVSEESGHTNLLELDFKHPGYFCGFCNAFNKPCSFTQRERWSRKRWSSPWNC